MAFYYRMALGSVVLLLTAGLISTSLKKATAGTPLASQGPILAVAADQNDAGDAGSETGNSSRRQGLMVGLWIFVLSIFLGFQMITKVPPTLHTPLMSGANAISGITLVGAVLVAGVSSGFPSLFGMVAVILATINAVGGFLVTHRMLAMFKKR